MKDREISKYLIELLKKLPLVGVLGPRQSGKTTLVKNLLPNYQYVNLEDPEIRAYAQSDPKSFLSQYQDKVIFDEIQNVPELFSYIQVQVDENEKPGRYVLTGSQNFLLLEKITQSLAGRISLCKLLPLSYAEVRQFDTKIELEQLLLQGSYPRLYKYGLNPKDIYPDYIQTYVERDIRLLKNIQDLGLFQRFIKMCAARTGQILNLSSLANDCGITHNTARSWLSLLESSFIAFTLKPFYQNIGKQLVKAPKLYFYDTGLLCSLIGIKSQDELLMHHMRGAIFESFIISECIKQYYNQRKEPDIYFYRDKTGNEVDLLIKDANQIIPIEIKSGKTMNNDYFKGLLKWQKLFPTETKNAYVIYAGNQNQSRNSIDVLNWQQFDLKKIIK